METLGLKITFTAQADAVQKRYKPAMGGTSGEATTFLLQGHAHAMHSAERGATMAFVSCRIESAKCSPKHGE